jgi:hypothetical protein
MSDDVGECASLTLVSAGSPHKKFAIPKRKFAKRASPPGAVPTSHGPPVMGTRDRSELDAKKRRSELDETKRKRRESDAWQEEMAKAIKAKEGAT